MQGSPLCFLVPCPLSCVCEVPCPLSHKLPFPLFCGCKVGVPSPVGGLVPSSVGCPVPTAVSARCLSPLPWAAPCPPPLAGLATLPKPAASGGKGKVKAGAALSLSPPQHVPSGRRGRAWTGRAGSGRAGHGAAMAEPGGPMRLKEWLIAQIDSGRYPGLRWENRHRTLFRIPWKHAAKQDYRQQQDAALFKVPRAHRDPPPSSGSIHGTPHPAPCAPSGFTIAQPCAHPRGCPAPCAPPGPPTWLHVHPRDPPTWLHAHPWDTLPSSTGTLGPPPSSTCTPGAPDCPAPRTPLGPHTTTQFPSTPQGTQPQLPMPPTQPQWTCTPVGPLGQWSGVLGGRQPLQHWAPSARQAWAIYKGKYHEGTDKADPSTWKTRLRCALNKSTDFQEVPERSQLDISEPYKVYQIVSDGTRDTGTSLPSLLLCQTWG